MTDEDTIRKRLLFDGDGTGEDRKINLLLKKFVKWCNVDETTKFSKEQLLAQVVQCENSYYKSRLVADMAAAELGNYVNLTRTVEKNIEDVKEEIIAAKQEFQEAKKIKRNQIEYEVKAKTIKEQPDRKETQRKLINLRKELEHYEEKYQQLEEKLEMRRKQFHVLITSLQQLQTQLDEDISTRNGYEPLDSSYEIIDVDDNDCDIEMISS